MLSSSPPSASYGLSAANTQGNQPLGQSGSKGAGLGNSLGTTGLSADPLSPQALQQGKLTMMIQALMGQGGNNVSL